MKKLTLIVFILCLSFLLTACGGGGPSAATAPLNPANLNLIFVVSEDLAYNAAGDIDPITANLTEQGLQRALRMGTFLKQKVLGTYNVTKIYALEPMTHLQTAKQYPDMTALVTIEQFAMLNQYTEMDEVISGSLYTANSFPINVGYTAGSVPAAAAPPLFPSNGREGLDFNDQGGDNEALLENIIKADTAGFYVFSAPWETVSGLLANINKLKGYNLALPAAYEGPNYIYAISLTPEGSAGLTTFNSNLRPPSTYPTLPAAGLVSAGPIQAPFSIKVTGGVGGAVIPAGINTSETVYLIRHAEAHPQGNWDDGNNVAAGQWRALALPNALRGKISPDMAYSIDPAQVGSKRSLTVAYIRPSLTIAPYVIANHLPFYLAANFELYSQNPPAPASYTSDFFFSGGQLSNHKILVGWEHNRIPTTVNALLARYFPGGGAPTAPAWPTEDYDTVWTVTIDAAGNLTVDNAVYQGIQSATLPADAPPF
jgi:hypothetical protein